MNVFQKFAKSILCSFFFLTLLVPAEIAALQWPVWPDSSYQQILASYGLVQGTWLHNGVDLRIPAYTPVYAIESGYVKAVTTIFDQYSFWRVLIADSSGTQQCEGWMYAHLHPNFMAVSVGDWVNAGDSIGIIVDWPYHENTNPQLHLSRVRFAGDSAAWANGWATGFEFIANPFDFLDNIEIINDTDLPVIENAWGDQLFAFCQNQVASYFPEDGPVSGDVDIVTRVYDYLGFYELQDVPYKMEYKIEGDSSIPWTTTYCFNISFGTNDTSTVYRSIIYQDDYYCNTESYFPDSSVYFFNLTNTDGDGFIETSDAEKSWQTAYFHNGDYEIFARATDYVGHVTVDSMTVAVENAFELSGTILLENQSYHGQTIIQASPPGRSDTTNYAGQFTIPDVGGGTQQIEIRHVGFEEVDTVFLMTQDSSLYLTLDFLYYCGDANNDLTVNILDITFLISYLYKDGPTPDILEACDVNSDGTANLLDITYLISFLYKGGSDPTC